MKRLILIFILLLLSVGIAADQQIPAAQGHINDYANLLDRAVIQRLEARAATYREQTGNEVAVLIVNTIGRRSLEDYAHDVFQSWGIGSKDNDNGVLFLVAIQEQRARIEVGYGLEGDLTDIECGRLVNKRSPMAQSFRNRDYAGGVNAVFDGIVQAIGGEYDPPQPKTNNKGKEISSTVIFFLILGIFILGRFNRRGRGFWRFGGPLGGGGGFTLGGGSGFGGGGGFGGGSSGGGGASGGW